MKMAKGVSWVLKRRRKLPCRRPLLTAIEYRGLGSDGRRVLKAMRFLKTAVQRTSEAPAETRRQDMNAERGYEG
ncbi:hypothetical protein NA8A_13769 [Nitratireductor indicus C115]|uniref:Uncharacterized protein n=1 Tax=Nitratireductor indicus C115 TaxID=1231190 RepID=K2NV23_9HYPH|nr:hypothetical protein NA8A_13769 [Nitratireductor indicus C115]